MSTMTTTDPGQLRADLAACKAIAEAANANFLHAARLLPAARQDFFHATYAAMRWIDDKVDDDFLMAPKPDRQVRRPEVARLVRAWQDQAMRGTIQGPMPAEIARALAATAGRSDLGDWPWRALAGALSVDVEEREMVEWIDFLAYCEGATVAPAAIFIYLLAAERDGDGRYRYPFEQPARWYAEDLGIYCYLVHILRDLKKDSEGSPRLVTIPTEIITEAKIAKGQLPAAIRAKSEHVDRLARLLIAKALPFRAKGHMRLDDVASRLGLVEATALRGLIKIYDRLFEAFQGDYVESMDRWAAMEQRLRKELLSG